MQTMATQMRFLSGRLPRVSICYNGGFKVLSSLLQRGYAAQDGGAARSETVIVFEAKRDQECPDSEMFVKAYDDKFGEQFRHFPLPGNATTAYQFITMKEKNSISLPKITSAFDQSDILSAMTSYHRHLTTLQIFAEASRKLPPPVDECTPSASVSFLECVVQPCPELVRKHFANLFPDRDIQKGTLTVLILTQRTENDMSSWSDEADREREELITQFISSATTICESLTQGGHWADFIDPTTGKPYLGPFTSATLFETDERYRHFGFTIEDLGCCKIIRHSVWGTHAFVGSIFSDVSLDSPVLQKLLPEQRTVVESESGSLSTSDELRSQQSFANCSQPSKTTDEKPSGITRKIKKDEIRVLKRDE